MKRVLEQLGYEQKTVNVFTDSQGAIHLSKHQVFHERSKHFEVKLHYTMSSTGNVKAEKIGTQQNPLDMLTKIVPLATILPDSSHACSTVGW